MAWQKLISNTISSIGDNISSGIFTANTFIQLLNHTILSGTGNNSKHRFGNGSVDTGNNYALRESFNSGADTTSVSRADIFGSGADPDNFEVTYAINIGTEEKLFILFQVNRNTAGAGNVPHRDKVVAKWVNTSNQFNITDINNDDTSDYDIGSNLSVLGTSNAVDTIE